MDVIAAYREVGSYRGAAAICGTTHKTVKRIIEAHEAGAGAGREDAAGQQLRRGRRPGREAGQGHRGPDLGQAAAAGGAGGGL